MNRFRVKVCGITRPGDAALAAQLGADLIGVVFYSRSPRAVTPRDAHKIMQEIPAVLQRVGVFVDHPVKSIIGIARGLRLNFVQLHGRQTDREIRLIQDAGIGVIRAVDGSTRTPRSSADILMLDNMASGQPGGTGQAFAWPARPRRTVPNLMLAGGLNERNVADGVRLFNPMIVDVNSGVESAPGIKSKAKLTRFMQECDRIRYGG